MSGTSIIYGKIVSDEDRQKIEEQYPNLRENILWFNTPEMFENSGGEAVVLVDLDNPAFAAPDFLVSIATAGQNVKIIGKSKSPSLDSAVRVAKLGVSEILSSEKCLERLHQFLTELEKQQEIDIPQETKYRPEALIGISPAIREIRKTIKLLAEVDYPSVLILGRTGTGKGLVAKILHHTGLRAKYNFVEVNCSTIPDELFESELFGHAKGSFTDAKKDKVGLLEYAQNGTLFLDEVGNLTPSAQAKLLKVVEDKKLRRVGDVGEKHINVRVVAATNLNLQKAIAEGKFREDLYFRLNLLTIELPPLSSRPVDIPVIAKHYAGFYSALYGKPRMNLSQRALEEMDSYRWPGNVRELCNTIERAVLLNKTEEITYGDIKAALKKKRISSAEREQLIIDLPSQGKSLQEIELDIVKQILNVFDWNKSEAAKFLGISRPRLRRILARSEVSENRREK